MKTGDQRLTKFVALGALIAVGVIFYSSYGGANWLAGQRDSVPEIAFAWERSIPFWPWTIVPYWTLNLFYAAAFFLCRTKKALWRYVQQLLLAQTIAVLCFILWPLQFSWSKPASDGLSAWLFQALGAFDQPYNQAPSLHIMLSIIVGYFYWLRFPAWRTAIVGWFSLIAVSVLTTWQHHFIDIPTGVLAAAVVLWLLPTNQPSPVCRMAKRLHPRCSLAYALLTAVAVLLMFFAGSWLWTGWIAAACVFLVLAYAGLGAQAFQKQSNGRHSMPVTLLLAPYYLACRANIAFWLRGKPRVVRVTDRVQLGSIVAAKHNQAMLDVCAEYPLWNTPTHYQSVPMLDLVSPKVEDLRRAADGLEDLLGTQSGPVLVACALGYGRSAAVVLTWLVRYGNADTLTEAKALLLAAQPHIVISETTQRAIEEAIND
ncbi:phosphatase PAP2/dual specificity phosphatase family protein [Suttonella sp. R2A3]|uniref:phosphatase PAP2/dual specificity phosphatase family protein n=1 Tax=Suttonella sp. R2A3 TaxID=2908648 RepID=UPI001F35B52E|nr:phosphatase PAP2/dual specificity phosphatase family protein [Suttonella sp. R2A3]UJF24945.1 phosphatase PAP2/dual specificity phosphatase family protein [Suttonella sp. R2A3]